MQKYIAVVNPRMDDDEISQLIAKDIAGALFSISHENYALASKLIQQVKKLSKQHNRPVSIMQDVSDMTDPLNLEFGMKNGADWIVTDKHDHLKMARGLNKLANVIYKGRDLPKGFRVDSVMADNFLDPDAEVMGKNSGHQIKHLITEHGDQKILDVLMHVVGQAHTVGIAVSDLDLAKALSFRRVKNKIFFMPQDPKLASRAAIYWGVYPVWGGKNLAAALIDSKLAHKKDRIVDARDMKHVSINLLQLS